MKKNVLTIIPVLILIGFLFAYVSCEKVDVQRVTKLKTLEVSDFTPLSVKANAEFIDLTYSFDYGFCYGKNSEPTLDDHFIRKNGQAYKGKFDENIEGLEPGTSYYLRAYAYVDDNLIYANEVNFTTYTIDMKITSPGAGDVWQRGTVQEITWTDNIGEDVRLELWRKNQDYSYEIINGAAFDYSYNWSISGSLPAESGWRIKIVYDTYFAFSEEFEISAP